MSGLRLVVTAHVPGLWSEAAKGLFDAKSIPYVLVEQVVGGENRDLREWTAQTSGPCAVYDDERPRSTWVEQLYLAERLSPEPALIPADIDERIAMFGLCNELCGDHGFGWNFRLLSIHRGLTDPGAPERYRILTPKLAAKYGYDAALIGPARAQMIAIIERLRDRLEAQAAKGSRFLIGDRLSALDIYWAAFAGGIDPLSPELTPGLSDITRANYTDAELSSIAGSALLAHRDFIYATYLKLPLDF